MKNKYRFLKINDFAEVVTGGTPSTKVNEYWENGKIPWLPSRACKNQRIKNADKFITELGLKNSSAKLMPKNTVLIALTGATTGKVGILDFEASANQSVTGIIPNNNFIPEYLYFFLMSYRKKILFDSYGGAQKHISQGYVKNIKVPLPDIPTQQEIANILLKTNTQIERSKDQLKLLTSLEHSIFYDLFGDPERNDKNFPIKPFNYFAKIDTKMIKDFSNIQDLPHIGIENIEKNTGQILGYKTVRDSKITSGKYYFTSEHIIYSKIRPYLNKVALPSFEGVCSADAYPILVNKEYTNKVYFAYLLRSTAFLNYINKTSSRTNIPKTNKKELSSFYGIYPPIELQNKFSNIIIQLESKRKKLIKRLELLEDLNQTLLNKYFKVN